MNDKASFRETIDAGYTFKGKSIILGGAMLEKECQTDCLVRIPLLTLNRHGLIAGATGTGKTKTLQILAEQLSREGVPSLIMDIKGDLSGIAVPSAGHPKINERHQAIGIPFEARGSSAELLSLSEEKGVRLRATVTEFGPVLFSRMLDLNETQAGIMSIIFKYADDRQLPLLDLQDVRKILQYASNEGKDEISKDYGSVSTASVGAINRKLVELEQQGAATFFGEPSFDVDDLVRTDENGFGYVHILRLTDVQDRPRLFSTFMLQMLAEVYASFPEAGDMEKPRLVLFIDEAHLIFDQASRALLSQLEIMVKLIRSKGVGLFFVTQDPSDIPESILGQLGLKIQHALRAFTAKDRKSIRLTAQNYPTTDHYEVETLLTELGIGEALVTALNEKGIPTPLVHTLLRAPESRMDVLTVEEIQHLVDQSELVPKYRMTIDRESAHEILSKKVEEAFQEDRQAAMKERRMRETRELPENEKSIFEQVSESPLAREIGRTVMREATRALLGVLGVSSGSRRKKKGSWF